MQRTFAVVLVLAGMLGAQSQFQTVPAAHASTDANSYVWMPGAMEPVRQVTLVGASHLASMIGRPLVAIEFRRTADDIAYSGGVADLTVHLSHSPRAPLTCAQEFNQNVGADAVAVFQGNVSVPPSPIETGPQIAWAGDDLVRIPFQVPFVYQGGALCVDIVGAPAAGQSSDWWMADAVWEINSGSVVQIGPGCGLQGGSAGEWSFADAQSLLPGAFARFWARGATGTPAIAVVGAELSTPLALSSLGIPAPGCSVYVDPSSVLLTSIAFFQPSGVPGAGALASLEFQIPGQPWVLGTTLATQWLDLAQPATSNGLRWTVAAAMPTLDMALVDGHPADAIGNVTVHLAHVMRFEFQ